MDVKYSTGKLAEIWQHFLSALETQNTNHSTPPSFNPVVALLTKLPGSGAGIYPELLIQTLPLHYYQLVPATPHPAPALMSS